jgi:hypothetical protein
MDTLDEKFEQMIIEEARPQASESSGVYGTFDSNFTFQNQERDIQMEIFGYKKLELQLEMAKVSVQRDSSLAHIEMAKINAQLEIANSLFL